MWYVHMCVSIVARGKRQWRPYYAYLKGFLLYLQPVSQVHTGSPYVFHATLSLSKETCQNPFFVGMLYA